MKFRLFLLFFCSAILSGCVARYDPPSKDTEFATVIFEKGYLDGSGFGKASAQEYSIIRNKGCEKPERMAFLTWVDGKTKSVRLPVNKPIEIIASNIDYISEGVSFDRGVPIANINEKYCRSKLTFIPEVGKTYKVSLIQKSSYDCKLEAINNENAKLPAGAIIEDSFICEN